MRRLCLASLAGILAGSVGTAEPFRIDVSASASADGKVDILATANKAWRGTVTVRDAKERLVAIVCKDEAAAYGADQQAAFVWDGKDDLGQRAPTGRYSVRVEALAAEPVGRYDRKVNNLYSYVRFDALERAVYMTGYTYFEEPPWTLDHTLPERFVRRMDFDGFPMGPVIPFDNVHWNHNLLIHDVDDDLYVPGANGQGPQPFKFFKINGLTGETVWERLALPPKGTDPKEWYPRVPLARGWNWDAGVVANNGQTAMWDTDAAFYCGTYGSYLTHVDCRTGDWIRPPFRVQIDDTWRERLGRKGFHDQLNQWVVNYLAVPPNGEPVVCPMHQWSGYLLRIRPDGTIIWSLSPHREGPPRAPEFAGAAYGGKGTHDNASIVSDVTGSLYRNGAADLVKMDPWGQLLLVARVTGSASACMGDMDVSADGRLAVYSLMHQWNAFVQELDWAEAEVVTREGGPKPEPEPVLPELAPIAFLSSQETAADWLNYGRWLLASRQYDKAISALEEVMEREVSAEPRRAGYRAVALVNMARAWERQGQWDRALATYERLGKAVPREAGWSSLTCARIEKQLGREEAAIQRLAKAAAEEKDAYLRAAMLLELAKWQPAAQAVDLYREVADRYYFARGYGLMGLIPSAVETADWKAAESAARELTANYPEYGHRVARGYWPKIRAALSLEDEPAETVGLEGKPGTPGDRLPDFVLGQDEIGTSTYPIAGAHPTYMSGPNSFGWPTGIELAGGKLWVADLCKGRIVSFGLPIEKNRPDEQTIIGKLPPGGTKAYWTWPGNMTGAGEEEGLRIPWAVATDGQRLYVSDHALHRVLVLNPEVPDGEIGKPADPLLVLGQTNETARTFNGKTVFEGDVGTPSAWSLMMPCALSCDRKHLAVADCGNHRVLVWNSLPSRTGQPADLVLGQKDFTSAVRGRTGAAGMNRPRGVFTDGTRLFVADTMNHRVLVWTTLPTRNGQPADLVLGVPDFETAGEWPVVSDGRAGPDSMSFPNDVYFDGKSLYVCDSNNNRVMIWDSLPAKNGQPCDRYLGAPGPAFQVARGFRFGRTHAPARELSFPTSVRADHRAIYVCDSWFNRVAVFLK